MLNRQIFKIADVESFARVVLTGCCPKEQNRPLEYKPGIGVPTSAISEASLSELPQRALFQGDLSVGNGGSLAPARSSQVRSPGQAR